MTNFKNAWFVIPAKNPVPMRFAIGTDSRWHGNDRAKVGFRIVAALFARLNLKPMVFLLFLFFLAGCVGYRLGSTLPPDIKTIYVPVFLNKCKDPLIENDATAALIAELQKDGTLKVVNAENADVILECTLTGISLNPLRYNRSDVTKPNEYRLTLSASFTLKRISSRETLCEASVIGESTFPFYGNLVSAKQLATPRAAEDLAKRIVEKAIEAW